MLDQANRKQQGRRIPLSNRTLKNIKKPHRTEQSLFKNLLFKLDSPEMSFFTVIQKDECLQNNNQTSFTKFSFLISTSPLMQNSTKAFILFIFYMFSDSDIQIFKGNSLARNFRSVSHHGPLLLICRNFNVIAVTPIITIPEE